MTAPQPTKPLRLSASSYKTFADCPRKWWYEKVLGKVAPPKPHLALGSDVHTVLEHFIAHGTWPTRHAAHMSGADTPEHFQRVLSIAQASGGSEESLKVLAALHACKDYDTHIEARVSLSADVFGIPFLGFVDFCEQAHRVVDHKTTSDLYAPWHHDRASLAQDPQLLIYAWVLWKGESPPLNVTVEHYYYQTRGAPAFRSLAASVPWEDCEATAVKFASPATSPPRPRRAGTTVGAPTPSIAPFLRRAPPRRSSNSPTPTPPETLCPFSIASRPPRTPLPRPRPMRRRSHPSCTTPPT